jgi:nitrogen fixation NifU-like protein
MEQSIKKAIILHHYENPTNFHKPKKENLYEIKIKTESCIDNLTFWFEIKENIIKNIYFKGEACAISTSSASIMINLIKGKNKQQAITLMKNFNNMIDSKSYDINMLEEANAFDEIHLQPSRIRCAQLPWLALKEQLEDL